MPNAIVPWIRSYGSAAACVALATGARLLLDPALGDRFPFLTFVVAVAFVAWHRGLAPAITALGLSCGAVAYFLLPPRGSLAIHGLDNQVGFALFLLAGVVVACLSGTMKDRKRADQAVRESEARKTAILETALDCIISIDHLGRVVEFNPAAEKAFGLRRAEVLGRELADLLIPPPLRERHRRGMAHYLATGEGPVLNTRVELPALRADGTEFPVELAITRIPVDGPPLFTAYLRDISERVRTDRQRNTRLAVTGILAQATTGPEAARGVLQAVCENLEWDIGFFWVLDPGADALRCEESWHRPDVQVTQFETTSRRRTFTRGVGLPGHAWATGKPAWVLDVVHDANFPRVAPAALEGLHGAFACPLGAGAETLGVIEFFSRRIREPDPDLLEMMNTVAGQIGQFLQRGRAERALREVEARFAAVVNHSPSCIFAKDRTGRYLLVNQAFARLAGRTPEEILGRTDADFFAPEVAARFAADDSEIRGEGRPRIYEESFSHAGAAFTALTVKFPLQDRDGQTYAVCGIATDISPQKRATEALADSAERLRLALEAGRMGVWDWNLRTDVIQCSDHLEPIHGLARGAFAGTLEAFQNLIHPDDREPVVATIRKAVEEHSGFAIEYRTRWPDGTTHWVAGRGKVFAAEDGPAARLIGVGMDVTGRKRVERASRFLADASAALAGLVDSESALQKVAHLAVPFFADWCIVDMLEATGSLRRIAVAHADPTKASLAHELQRRRPADGRLERVVRTGQSERVEEAGDEEPLGVLRELGLRSYLCVPLQVHGKTIGAMTFVSAESGRRFDAGDLAVAEDLANRTAVAVENTRLYQEVRDADRRKDEFLAMLAHELRNPLAPVKNALHIMKMPGIDGAALSRARDMAERQVKHLTRLVDDLLDVSRIMRGKVQLRKEVVELQTIVARAVEIAQPVIDAQGHRFTLSVPDEPLRLEADPLRLAQVIANLLNNAAKYTEKGGQVWLTAERAGGEIVLRVRDTGVGMALEVLPRVFDLFVQVDRSIERAQGGLGIGLTLVKSLVGLHGGAVEARSDGPGQGSEFIVRLPAAAGKQQVGGGQGSAEVDPAPQVARRILVVDDNADAADSLAIMLRLQGHEVFLARDGAAALDVVHSRQPDIGFLDIGMPVMDGYALAQRLRRDPALQGLVLVALTGWVREDDARRGLEAGFDLHLTKPVDIAALTRLLADLGGRR